MGQTGADGGDAPPQGTPPRGVPVPRAARQFPDPLIGPMVADQKLDQYFRADDSPADLQQRQANKAVTFGEYLLTKLKLPGDPEARYYWRLKKVEVKGRVQNMGALADNEAGPVPPVQAPEPLSTMGVTNANRDWLTYEAIFNQRPYRKTNQRCELGLYRMPITAIKVFLRDGVAPEVVKELIDAFFPDLDKDWLEGLSSSFWPWKKSATNPCIPVSPSQMVANRNHNIVYLKQYAILPFNYADNGEASHAIGKVQETELKTPLTKLNKTWGFWKTASRSNIVELKPVKKKGDPWQPLLAKPYGWKLATLGKPPPPDELGSSERETDLRAAWNAGQQFQLPTARNCFSVKTGVQYVGWVDQQGVHKDKLEENSVIACLRSDLVVEMDTKAQRNPKTDPDLLIQTELLSITELDRSGQKEFGDGVQVRDLSVLDPTKIYVPPISIPFLGTDLKQFNRRFAGVVEPRWRQFWQRFYAERFGRAKALMLLRYGLQMGSPNAQNLLLEFDPTKPNPDTGGPSSTGRVVLRDMGDAYLHREVLWAKFGGVGPPPVGSGEKMELRKLNSKIIQFECVELSRQGSVAEEWRAYVPYETGSLYEASYGPCGTRFLWHRFSTLSKGSAVFEASKMGTDPDAYSEGWQRVLATMCEWGLAHNRAYVAFIEEKLKLSCGINWDAAPQPDRYEMLAPIDRSGADRCYREDLAWEDRAADQVHAVLRSEAGQKAIRTFHG